MYDDHRHYIYTLSNNGSIVYIGLTRDAPSRYKIHHYDWVSSVFVFGRYLLSIGTPLKMEIIATTTNKKDGLILERQHIAKYSSSFYLLNDRDCCEALCSILPKFRQIVNSHLLHEEIESIQAKQKKWSNS